MSEKKLIRFATADGGWLYVDPLTEKVIRHVPGGRRIPNVRQLNWDAEHGNVDADTGVEEDVRQYYERSIAVDPGLAADAPGFQLINPSSSTVIVGLLRMELVMTQALDSSLGLLFVDQVNLGTATAPVKGLDATTAAGAISEPTSQALAASVWGTTPTLNTNWLRRQRMSALGETTVWTWDPEGSNGPPLMIPPGGSVVVAEWDTAATGSFLVNVRWQESRFGAKNTKR